MLGYIFEKRALLFVKWGSRERIMYIWLINPDYRFEMLRDDNTITDNKRLHYLIQYFKHILSHSPKILSRWAVLSTGKVATSLYTVCLPTGYPETMTSA